MIRSYSVAVLLSAACAGVHAADSTFPNKPVRIVVPFAPGGGTDRIARTLAQKLSAAWSQQVLVDNRPGGGTVIGSDLVAKSAADGHTLLLTANPHTTNPARFYGHVLSRDALTNDMLWP